LVNLSHDSHLLSVYKLISKVCPLSGSRTKRGVRRDYYNWEVRGGLIYTNKVSGCQQHRFGAIEGIDYVSNVIEHGSRAPYYPGVTPVRVKLLADKKTGRLLGAQMVGREGVAKRIGVFATAITVKMTDREMRDLDLGYAPPFSPPYDAILIAADELQKKLPAKN
jgi:NADPH-dependent 2,4-dienoyl-CoA reductase/sulfur reductase-like enzyme